jgi:dienelactone hydrolase
VRNPAFALAVTCLAAFSLPAFAAAPAARGPKLEVRPPSPAATPDFRWTFGVLITNDTDTGNYPDSVTAMAEDMDPGKVDGPRKQPIPLASFSKLLRPLSAGESQSFNYSGNGYYERTRVTFRLYSHTSDGKKLVSETVTEIRPGPSSEQYASQTFEIGGRKVEYVLLRGGKPPSPWPGLLIVHGERGNARRLLPFAREAAITGYTVIDVSLPGFGVSDGDPDLMGPASMAVLEKAYALLKSHPDVDSTKMSAWGVSLGAGLVARFAVKHPELKAVVLQAGVFDLWAVGRARGADGVKEFVRQAGSDSAAWRERSAAVSATKIACPVLVMQDDRDPATPLAQAQAYADVLRQGGGTVEFAMPDGASRARPLGAAADLGLAFVEAKVGSRSR